LFVAYAPISAPRYAVAVVIEQGAHGGSAAGPVARDMLIAAQSKQLDASVPGSTAAPGVVPAVAHPPDPGHDDETSPDTESDGGT
jgi:penicillin-binding protein 2